jgi:hypothetical protein
MAITTISNSPRGTAATNITIGLATNDSEPTSIPKKRWPKFVKPNRHERRKAKANRTRKGANGLA